MAVDGAGNVYVADPGDATIRKVTPAGVVTTLAGLVQFDQLGNSMAGSADGTGSAARFQYPQGVAVDSSGTVYVADTGNYTIRKGYPALMMLSFGPSFGFNDGQFGFVLSGPPGQLVVVEASTDLVDWLPLWTNTFAGDLQFSDLQSDAYPYRFYRAHLP
jgi:DNA-binding beta-propeller fold protein YncE